MDEVFIHHPYPVLGDEADAIVTGTIEDECGTTHEHLPSRRLGNDRYKICCIPCFVKDIALADVVAVKGGLISEVVEPSGRCVFRAWSDDGWNGKFEVLHQIAARGGLMETCTHSLMGIDVQDANSAAVMRTYLDELEAAGALVYETGWS